MTANVPIVLVQFLALAFFVVIAIGVALGWYAARSLKRAEQQIATTETPTETAAQVTTYEPAPVAENSID